MDFPDCSEAEECTCNAGDMGFTPGLGRSPGEGNGNTLAWEIPCMKEPGRLQSMGSDMTEVTEHTGMHAYNAK